MFSREIVDLSRFPMTAAAGADAFASLAEIVGRFAPEPRVADLSLAAWSIVHGYATLCVEIGLESREKRADRAELFAALIQGSV